MTDEAKAWWELSAAWFQDDIDLDVGVNWTSTTYDEDLTLLSDVEDTEILELGCGGGQCSIALAKRGANVTGIDLSEAQLAFARDLAAEHDVAAEVDFLQGDVTDLGTFTDDRFDVAFNAAVFQWVGDLESCFQETVRVLRPGGRFVFSMPHPFNAIVDHETGRVEGSYFDTGRHVRSWEELDEDMVTYRHTVSGVLTELVEAGFDVERMREPGSSDPDDYVEGPWGENQPETLANVPSNLIFETRTPESTG